jgi:hypothetical protein
LIARVYDNGSFQVDTIGVAVIEFIDATLDSLIAREKAKHRKFTKPVV